MPSIPRLRPRGLREAWWVAALAVVAVGLFSVGLAVGVRCRLHGCVWSRDRFFALDAIGGLPRLFTTGLFVAVAVAGWFGARRVAGRARMWWTAVAVVGAVLAVLKLVSTHSTAKAAAAVATLVGGVALSAVVLTVLWRTARRWGVAAGPPVVVALGVYAFAALGLDAVTGLLATLHGSTGAVLDAVSTFVEELGEALAALLVLAVVWWCLPSAQSPSGSVRQQ
jgi:hypothetical protein